MTCRQMSSRGMAGQAWGRRWGTPSTAAALPMSTTSDASAASPPVPVPGSHDLQHSTLSLRSRRPMDPFETLAPLYSPSSQPIAGKSQHDALSFHSTLPAESALGHCPCILFMPPLNFTEADVVHSAHPHCSWTAACRGVTTAAADPHHLCPLDSATARQSCSRCQAHSAGSPLVPHQRLQALQTWLPRTGSGSLRLSAA